MFVFHNGRSKHRTSITSVRLRRRIAFNFGCGSISLCPKYISDRKVSGLFLRKEHQFIPWRFRFLNRLGQLFIAYTYFFQPKPCEKLQLFFCFVRVFPVYVLTVLNNLVQKHRFSWYFSAKWSPWIHNKQQTHGCLQTKALLWTMIYDGKIKENIKNLTQQEPLTRYMKWF